MSSTFLQGPNPVPWIILENVPFMLHLERGRAMDYVIGRLENLGYKWAYRVIDTKAFGLPHRRERVFVLASLDVDPSGVFFATNHPPRGSRDHSGRACGFYWTEGNRGLGWAVDAIPTLKAGSGAGIPSPPAVWMPDGRVSDPRTSAMLSGSRVFRPIGPCRLRLCVRPSVGGLSGTLCSVPVAKWIGERVMADHYTHRGSRRTLSPHAPWPRVPSVRCRDALQLTLPLGQCVGKVHH